MTIADLFPPSLTIDQALQQAVKQHHAGHIQEAERLYRAILQVVPTHPDANLNLGILSLQTEQSDAALGYLKSALEHSPNQAVYWLHYIDALLQCGQADRARQVLAEGRQYGLQGDAVESLATRLGADLHDREMLIALFDQGRFAEVEQLALAMAEQFPLHCFAWKVLGILHRQMGRSEEALSMMQKAAALAPNDAEAHNNLGALLRELRRLPEAQASCRRALALKPDYAEAYNNLGNTLQELRDAVEAQRCYQQALQIKPDYAEAHNNLGMIFRELGRLDEALASCRRALVLKPDYAEAYNNLGCVLQAMGCLADAQASYRRSLELKPGYAEAHNNLGTAFKEAGRLADAEDCYQRALKLKPAYAEAHGNLANLCNDLGRFADAQRSYQRALESKPDSAQLHNHLGYTLKELGQFAQAEASCRRALALEPDYAAAHSNLGLILVEVGRLAEAEISYGRALEIEPDNSMFHSNLLCALNFTGDQADTYCFEEACRFGRRVGKQVGRRFSAWPSAAAQPERLRVGFVSADLRRHPVGYFLESLLPYMAQTNLELLAYHCHPNEDELTARIKTHFSAWHSTANLNDEAAARRIHADGVHILLDLAGHTARNRLPIFAWKPAPVQVSWLGYFATTGMQEMDYLLADAVSLPAGQRTRFTEQIYYLPDTRLCFTAPQHAPDIAPLPALTRQYITFASFQNLAKITDPVLILWGRVLSAVPDARLRLQNRALEDPAVRAAFLLRLQQVRIDPRRVEILQHMSHTQYLAAHAEVDFILDTFPYTGGTTTCEALWMGVPTLTLEGDTLLARQGASLLTAAGMSDWIARDPDAYVHRAQALVSDLPALAKLRAGLRAQLELSPLFDAQRFSRNLEAALWAMWRRHAAAAEA